MVEGDEAGVRNLNWPNKNEIPYWMLGTKLGSGQFRDVYISTMHERMVLKVERFLPAMSNMVESDTWVNLRSKPIAKWLAPVYFISPDCSVLMMSQTTPLKSYPKKIPAFFADTKLDNWGSFEGRPVCHDYGNNRIYGIDEDLTKMVPAKWWSEYDNAEITRA